MNGTSQLPKVTIGVTTYNRQEYLARCIRSILNQKYQHFEIVIGNDYVDVPVTFESIGIRQDHRIKILNYEVNMGAYNNNYSLIRNAEGDYFTWLADDDLMHPLFLQKAYEALTSTEALAFFSSYSDVVVDEEDFLAASHDDGLLTVYDCCDFISDYASRKIRVVGSYGVFKRQVLEAIYSAPKFGTGLAVYVDTFIPVIVAAVGRIAYWNKDLIFLRTHPASQSASSCALEEYSSAQVDFLKEFNADFALIVDRTTIDKWLRDFILWFSMDAWHVTCRGTAGPLKCIKLYLTYFRQILLPRIPATERVALSIKILTTIAIEAARMFCRRVIHQQNN